MMVGDVSDVPEVEIWLRKCSFYIGTSLNPLLCWVVCCLC